MPGQELQAIADRGYFNGEEVLACEQAGITAYVSKPMTSEAKAEGRFDKSDFVYQPDTDTYRCPAGSSSSDASAGWSGATSFTATGARTARAAPSRPSARQATTAVLAAGSTRLCSKRCKSGWTANRM